MSGAFGGLLAFLGALGLGLEYLARWALWLLIGSRAFKWSLATLEPTDNNFKEQRLERETIGGLAVFTLEISLLPSGFYVGFISVVVFVGAYVVREYLETEKKQP